MMASGNYSASEAIHGCGQTGQVMHPSNRHTEITSSTRKGMDPGMHAGLGRPQTKSDYPHPTPTDVTTAPGQRTALSVGYGKTPPSAPNR